MELVIQPFESLPDRQDREIVERKGLGHPDTLCDAIAERICVRLCRWHLDWFDTGRTASSPPYRFMTMEAAAGKNPMNHVGKLYNVVADRIAAELVTDVDGVRAAACVLVSQIGHVVDDPQVADIRLAMNKTTLIDRVRAQTETAVHDQLRSLSEIRQGLLDERLTVY